MLMDSCDSNAGLFASSTLSFTLFPSETPVKWLAHTPLGRPEPAVWLPEDGVSVTVTLLALPLPPLAGKFVQSVTVGAGTEIDGATSSFFAFDFLDFPSATEKVREATAFSAGP